MNTQPHPRFAQGFTLMETLIAILVLGIVSVGVISLNGQLFWQSAHMRHLQQATQLQQACVEEVLAMRQTAGYAASLHCDGLNSVGTGFTLAVSQAASAQYCPSGFQCRQMNVSVSGQGISPAAATLLFVDY